MRFTIVTENGLDVLVTKCPGRGCEKPYKIDSNHPLYKDTRSALERGNRSVLHCYHKRLDA